MNCTREDSWKEDDSLKSDLNSLVENRLRRSEILDYMKRDYVNYAWSITTLERRLNVSLSNTLIIELR